VDDALHVTVVDVDADALLRISAREGSRISTRKADLRDREQVRNIVRGADLVVGAVPGWLGYAVLHEVIAANKSFVDISFMPEDPRPLSESAEAAGVVGLVDFGVAPGMSNVLATRAVRSMDRAEDIRIYVGGLPQVRRFPYEYAAVFSPADVIEEYTRPARLVEHGHIVVKPALSEIEPLEFDGVGTLEAFNTDGLRSLMWTLDVPNMREKTLRYPGHATRMRMLRETGFLSSRHVRVGNVDVRPVDVSLALLASAWKLPEGEGDITVMRVEARGVRGGNPVREAYDLLDRYDPRAKTTSMARTTGFPCAIAARMLLSGKLSLKPGVHFPEAVASEKPALEHLLDELSRRGVTFRHTTGEQTDVRQPGGPRRLPTVS
jgi:saccharopine dehydrogenase-like NADP-dependent oxidoreductase